MINLFLLSGVIYAFVLQNGKRLEVKAPISNINFSSEINDSSLIDADNIFVDEENPGVIYYIVQPGDNLSKIANKF
jgi:hypothetical protein